MPVSCLRAGWRSGKTVEPYSEFDRFQSQSGQCLSSWFSSVFPDKCRVTVPIRPCQTLSFKSFLIHYSWIILSFDAIPFGYWQLSQVTHTISFPPILYHFPFFICIWLLFFSRLISFFFSFSSSSIIFSPLFSVSPHFHHVVLSLPSNVSSPFTSPLLSLPLLSSSPDSFNLLLSFICFLTEQQNVPSPLPSKYFPNNYSQIILQADHSGRAV